MDFLRLYRDGFCQGTGKRGCKTEKHRCRWVDQQSDIMIRYHDEEWGTPVHDDRLLFEFMCLDAFQAGLSWLTVLKKRENLKKSFFDFDIDRCVRMTEKQMMAALNDPGIIRNRLKVFAVKKNALAALAVIGEFGSLDEYLWSMAGGRPSLITLRASWIFPPIPLSLTRCPGN